MKERGRPLNETFPRTWNAQVLTARPLILPRLHHVYPLAVEEVERGALELMVTPAEGESFLATCALGFNATSLPTGVWSCPHPDWLCAIAGGYAYMINSRSPGVWEQVEFRPVAEVLTIEREKLMVFSSFHQLVAYGVDGRRWKTQKLSSEGLRLGEARDGKLHGWGWEMRTDREIAFAVDLVTGEHTGGVPL